MKPALQRAISVTSDYMFWDNLRFLRMGRMDPTLKLTRTRLQMARWFKQGPATLELSINSTQIIASAWGDAAEEALERTPHLLGLHDTPVLDFGHPRLNKMLKPVINLRLSKSPFLSHALPSHILQQQIAWRDAARIWRNLCEKHGQDAPGPASLKLPLSFDQLRRLPHHSYQSAGLIENRIPLMREIGRLGHRIDQWYATSIETYARNIQTLPQMGPWTTFHALAVSMGEPDVVVTGDYTLPHTVSWALKRQARSTDQEMIKLLKPYKGNRWRLVRLLWALNIAAPRRGARMSAAHTRRR